VQTNENIVFPPLIIIIFLVPVLTNTFYYNLPKITISSATIILHNNPPLKMMKPKKEKIELYCEILSTTV